VNVSRPFRSLTWPRTSDASNVSRVPLERGGHKDTIAGPLSDASRDTSRHAETRDTFAHLRGAPESKRRAPLAKSRAACVRVGVATFDEKPGAAGFGVLTNPCAGVRVLGWRLLLACPRQARGTETRSRARTRHGLPAISRARMRPSWGALPNAGDTCRSCSVGAGFRPSWDVTTRATTRRGHRRPNGRGAVPSAGPGSLARLAPCGTSRTTLPATADAGCTGGCRRAHEPRKAGHGFGKRDAAGRSLGGRSIAPSSRSKAPTTRAAENHRARQGRRRERTDEHRRAARTCSFSARSER